MQNNDEHNEGSQILTPKGLTMGYAFYKKFQTKKQKKVWEENLKEEQQIGNLTMQPNKKKKSDSKFKKSATKKTSTSTKKASTTRVIMEIL
jgi:hypothetical protein